MAAPFSNLTRYQLNTDVLPELPSQQEKLLLISQPLNSSQTAFLHKVMASVNVAPADFTLLMVDKGSKIRLGNAVELKGRTVIVFGFSPTDLGLSMAERPYELLRLYTCAFLFVDNLELIQDTVSLKKRLWEALKTCFVSHD